MDHMSHFSTLAIAFNNNHIQTFLVFRARFC
jgi:hypothetical protein